MSRYFLTILILSAILAQTFRTEIIMLDYYIQTASYLKNCVNKQKPVLNCKGKCQLGKKLQKSSDSDQKKPALKIDHQNIVISSKSFFATMPHQSREWLPAFNLPAPCSILTGNPKSIFRPPVLV